MNTPPSTEDRIWAAAAHLSSLALGMGIFLPILGWADRRRKSNYASFQCLQALGYQSLGYTVWLLAYLVIAVVIAIAVLALSGAEGERSSAAPWISGIVLGGLFALYLVLPVIAAVACALGRDFRYPLLGDRLARYLGYNPLQSPEEQDGVSEDHEVRWIAAAGHFSVLILMWGMLAPLTAWVLHGKHSLLLKFQSIQTLVYQAVVTLLIFTGTSLYLGGTLALVVSLAGQIDRNPSLGIVALVLAVILMAIGGVILLVIPLLHILGQWAGYRLLKGDDYRYPIVARLVDKRLSKTSASE